MCIHSSVERVLKGIKFPCFLVGVLERIKFGFKKCRYPRFIFIFYFEFGVQQQKMSGVLAYSSLIQLQ